MGSPVQALAWEIWSAHRRGWLFILAAIPVCAVLYRVLADPLHKSDILRSLSVLPMVLSLALVAAFFNFTESNRRRGFAGFPQRLFTMPVRTSVLVTCPMVLAVLCFVGVYIAWATLVLPAAGFQFYVRWPSIILAAGMVFYQSLIWCLTGFRIARIVALTITFCALLIVVLQPHNVLARGDTTVERTLTGILLTLMALAYVAAIVAVGRQRRGGGRGFDWARKLTEASAAIVPRRQWALSSPDRALFWLEWRRSGLVLPAGVLLTAILILGPIMTLSGRGRDATALAAMWLALLPILMAIPIGKGFSKPDFWSLDLATSPFIAVRPITSGQIVAAKMKSAALGTLLAWLLLLTIAPIWLIVSSDTSALRDTWGMFGVVYAPLSRVAILVLGVMAAIVLTWSVMIGSIWAGYSGRPLRFYGFMAGGVVIFIAATTFVCWALEQRDGDAIFVNLLPWFPWALAALVAAKVWTAVGLLSKANRARLLSDRFIRFYLMAWAAATFCLVLLACIFSPKVEWFRDVLLLIALLAVPLARIGAAPLAIAQNRHR